MTRMSDELPPAYANPMILFENKVRDELASVGLYEIITYRMTAPEREARFFGTAAERCVRLANPISPDRSVLRTSLLPGLMEVVERNGRNRSLGYLRRTFYYRWTGRGGCLCNSSQQSGKDGNGRTDVYLW